MYTEILGKIPLLISAILFLYAASKIYFRAKNVNKSEFFNIFKKVKYFNLWVLIISISLTGVFAVFNHINLRHSVHAIVALNYSEASQAQNSNGTRYNMAEILSDEVIEKAIENGAFENVTVKQLKNCLCVYPCIQGDVSDESKYHISTEFLVEYHASKHTAHLDAQNVINLITAAYKEYYIDKYTDSFKLDTMEEKPDFDKLEYMDIVAYFNKETSSILNYLYAMAEKAPSFVTADNATFNSIAGKVFQFKETQINENLNSFILQNGIVRNNEEYVGRLLYQNKKTDFDRSKNLVSFEICNEAIQRYAEEMTRVVLVPTWDQEGKYYMGRTKVGIDELSMQATVFSDRVSSNEKDIMNNNLVIDKMDKKSDASLYEEADRLVNSVYESIKAFEKEAVGAGREYSSYKMNQCIAVSIYGVSLANELKELIAFFIIAYVSVMLFYISRRFPKRQLV